MTHDRTAERDGALQWLKRVAGVDDDYLNHWPSEAWELWAIARLAPRDGLNPSVPEWMQPVLGQTYGDWSIADPRVARLWPTAHDWFAVSDEHADLNLTLWLPTNGSFDAEVSQMRDAWQLARDAGASPLMNVQMEPVEPWGEVIYGGIEAFYVAAPVLDELLLGKMNAILGLEGRWHPVLENAVGDTLVRSGHLAVDDPVQVFGWEWCY